MLVGGSKLFKEKDSTPQLLSSIIHNNATKRAPAQIRQTASDLFEICQTLSVELKVYEKLSLILQMVFGIFVFGQIRYTAAPFILKISFISPLRGFFYAVRFRVVGREIWFVIYTFLELLGS